MSKDALKWHSTLHNLKPALRVVLEALCKRHTSEKGCFPSQATIAEMANLSPASVNVKLKALEAMGLIKRVRSRDPRTRRQLRTRYILGFEPAFPTVGEEGASSGGASSDFASRPDSKISRNPTPGVWSTRLQKSEKNIFTESNKLDAGATRIFVSISDEAFSIAMYQKLAEGAEPESRWPSPPSFLQGFAADEVRQASVRLERQARFGFPSVSQMIVRAGEGRVVGVNAWVNTAIGLCEAVRLGSSAADAWKAEHARRGWPWFDGLRTGVVIHVPKGGVDGLDDVIKQLQRISAPLVGET